MEGMIEMAAALKKAIAEKGREVERELRELGIIHREYLSGQHGGCPCIVLGSRERCIMADTIERGVEELAGRPMPAAAGNSFN
jgi:hypothetical protein